MSWHLPTRRTEAQRNPFWKSGMVATLLLLMFASSALLSARSRALLQKEASRCDHGQVEPRNA